MQVDYLIVGQGLCGTLLSWFLHREGKSFMIIDEEGEQISSKVAAGVINPVTGRRYMYSWMIDEIMPFANRVYQEMGAYLDTRLITERSIIDFFPTPQSRNTFIERLSENDSCLHAFPDQNHFNQYFNYDFGCGEIRPAYSVHVSLLLASWRKKLHEIHSIGADRFEADALELLGEGIRYKGITAGKIIFCEGSAAIANPWFSLLPFAPNKGEALIIESEGLTNEHIFKKGLTLVPMPVRNTYWVGSNYQWKFEDALPGEAFRQQAVSVLNGWLKKPYRVLFHKAAVRPATIERRPFVGIHPQQRALGILNGMGTKGTSLAPFFANQLVQHLVHGRPITPQADINRFARILNR
ncbi:MAG TPA: FAD-dependent oxidoreductase [Flavisolibacter sp.]|nr:FAD-dependent oxidoreductase [Flavisolibacter sp.]